MERRLSAILAADVVGYTRLMERDEGRTFERLRAHRKELLEQEIAKHRGRIFKLMGDGLLAEFSSVVDAVECAVLVQRGMVDRNIGLAGDQRIDLRIGLTLADVIIDGEDRHGEGVNLAARLQQLAEPGGIAVSRTVADHVKHKLAVRFESRGEVRVKNIAEPVSVYYLRTTPAAAWRRTFATFRRARLGRKAIPAMAATVLVLVGGATAWHFFLQTRPTSRLSIAVLPFTNIGSDPEQAYFADAITDDLTTDLSRIEDSLVIAPNTARTYKGRNLDAKQIGRDLNVRYILEGSLRRAENQVRVNARLIDTESGAAIWSDRFDGDWTKSMQLQDEITGRLARRLDLELTEEESRRAQLERPSNPDAVDLTMRAWSVLNQTYSRERVAQARELFEQALRIDPGLSKALVGLSQALAVEVNYRWSNSPAKDLERADNAVSGVLATFPNDAMAHFVKGEIIRATGKHMESAVAQYESAIAINPSLAPAYAALGGAEIRAGRSDEAFAPLQKAIRLSPYDPLLNIWVFYICHAYTHLGQDNLAIEWCRRSVAINPFWIAYVDLASAYAWVGQEAEAHAAVLELRKLMPGYSVSRWATDGKAWSDNPIFLKQFDRIIEGVRRAGLPES